MFLKIFNSLSRKTEVFKPIKPPFVGMYTCGPTVYNPVSIGNWRTYVLGDLIVRSLKYFNYEVNYIMNITDVGHLTGDNLGDADIGEDRMLKARENMLYFRCQKCGKVSPAYISVDKVTFKTLRYENNFVNCKYCSFINNISKENLFYGKKIFPPTVWEIADKHTKKFLDEFKNLNLTQPKKFAKATKYIKEQIDLVKRIEKKGFTYKISDGIYFNVKTYEDAGNKYGQLSDLDEIKEGAKVAKNPEKKDPRDFALWKFSPKLQKRQMEWKSPWGIGFPGWHIECSAMSMKYLGEQFDIHVGGEDLKNIHHSNEVAQSEAATRKKPFVKYWIHGAFLQVDGRRMGKSFGNAYTLEDVEKRGFEPLALRYFYLTAHYRSKINFTWRALESSQIALNKLRQQFQNEPTAVNLLSKQATKLKFKKKFSEAISDDFNMPQALAVVWQMVKSGLNPAYKRALLLDFDQVLGLNLGNAKRKTKKVKDKEINKLILEREKLRKEGKWEVADKVRQEIQAKGFIIKDTSEGTVIEKRK